MKLHETRCNFAESNPVTVQLTAESAESAEIAEIRKIHMRIPSAFSANSAVKC
jgi:hypothetical protein